MKVNDGQKGARRLSLPEMRYNALKKRTWCFLMIPQKIDSHIADELRIILRKVNITNPRVTID